MAMKSLCQVHKKCCLTLTDARCKADESISSIIRVKGLTEHVHNPGKLFDLMFCLLLQNQMLRLHTIEIWHTPHTDLHNILAFHSTWNLQQQDKFPLKVIQPFIGFHGKIFKITTVPVSCMAMLNNYSKAMLDIKHNLLFII